MLIQIRPSNGTGGADPKVVLSQEIDDESLQLTDQVSGRPVFGNYVPTGAAMPFTMSGSPTPVTYGTATPDPTNNLVLGSDINGNVIGPLTSSGKSSVSLVWTDAAGQFVSSASAAVTGQSYASLLATTQLTATGLSNGAVPPQGTVSLVPTNVYKPVPANANASTVISINVPILQYKAYAADRTLGSVLMYYAQSGSTATPPPGNAFASAMLGPLRPQNPLGLTNRGQQLLEPANGTTVSAGAQQFFFKVDALSSAKLWMNPL